MGGLNSGGWISSTSALGGCETLEFEAHINSSQPEAIRPLEVDDAG